MQFGYLQEIIAGKVLHLNHSHLKQAKVHVWSCLCGAVYQGVFRSFSVAPEKAMTEWSVGIYTLLTLSFTALVLYVVTTIN